MTPSPSDRIDTLIKYAQQQLVNAGIERSVARLEAADLLSWAFHTAGQPNGQSGVDPQRIQMWALCGDRLSDQCDRQTASRVLDLFHHAVERRSHREPLQWITGTAPFRTITLDVGNGVFVPRPETEEVAGRGIELIRQFNRGIADQKKRAPQGKHVSQTKPAFPIIADLFAGSGAIGLSCAVEVPGVHVISVEKSDAAYEYLCHSAQRLMRTYPWLESCFIALHADVFDSTALIARQVKKWGRKDGLLDGIVTNPPYIPLARPVTQPEASLDPPIALYGGSADGLKIPFETIDLAANLLASGGFIVIEHDVSQQRALHVRLKRSGFTHVTDGRDITGRPRWVEARRDEATEPLSTVEEKK